jgi:hypothetical protein
MVPNHQPLIDNSLQVQFNLHQIPRIFQHYFDKGMSINHHPGVYSSRVGASLTTGPSQLSPQFLRSSRDTGSSCEMATANEKAGEVTWEMFYVQGRISHLTIQLAKYLSIKKTNEQTNCLSVCLSV